MSSLRAGLFLLYALATPGAAQVTKPATDSATLYNRAEKLTNRADSLSRGTVANQRQAIALFGQAVPLYTTAHARDDVMVSLFTIGQLYRGLHQPDSALIYFRKALPVANAIDAVTGQMWILQNTGLALIDEGHADSALVCFRNGLRIAATVADTDLARGMIGGIARSFQLLGHPDSALRYYRASLPGRLTVENRESVAATFDDIGGVWSDIGQLDSALVFYNDALDLRRDMKDAGLEGRSLHNIGGVYFNLGITDSALVYFRNALVMARQAKDRSTEGWTLVDIGSIFDGDGHADSALTYLFQAFPIIHDLGDPRGTARLSLDLGAIYSEFRMADTARFWLTNSVDLSHAMGDQAQEAMALNYIGRSYFGQANGDSALSYHRRALAIQVSASDVTGEASTLEDIGSVFRATKRADSAVMYYERAANLAATLSAQTGSEFNQLHFNEKSTDTYSLWALTWLDRARAGEASAATFAALAASERGRAQALLRLMGTRRASQPGADLKAEGKDLAQRALQSAVGALVYHAAGDTLITWLALKDGTIYASEMTVPEGHLDTLVAALRYSIAQEDAAVERNARITRGGSTQLDATMLPASMRTRIMSDTGKAIQREISALLLTPEIAAHLPTSGELLIIPHGPLGLVPFGLLRVDGDTARLGDRFALRYGPSLTAIAEAESRPGIAAGGNRAQQLAPALIVGDPVMPAPFSLDKERYMFDPLPGARIEGKAVADSLGATQWLSGAQASEAAVRAAIPTAMLVHLATHGLVYSSDAHARLSFVALAPDATHDGHLSVAKIVDSLTFKAELVVLSACQTAVGNVKSAEGTLGLQRAVLAKGARSVLVSLWNVNDESTLFLIERFYHHWLHDSNAPSKSEALRLAQADVRAEARLTPAHKNWADPMYWAAFQLVGAP